MGLCVSGAYTPACYPWRTGGMEDNNDKSRIPLTNQGLDRSGSLRHGNCKGYASSGNFLFNKSKITLYSDNSIYFRGICRSCKQRVEGVAFEFSERTSSNRT